MNANGPDESTRGLGASAARGAMVTMGGQVARIAIQLLGIVLLARLLDPSDYGLLAMVTAVIGIGEVLRDFGLSTAAVQARTLSKNQRDNLFWINSSIGAVFTIIVVLIAPLIAGFFSDERLQVIATALSVTFLINGLSTQLRADLNRSLRFGALALVDIWSSAIGLALGVAAALYGLEYWALIIQQITIPTVSLLVLIYLTRWRPGLPHKNSDMRSLLTFGGNLVGVQLLNYASRNVDSIVVGATLGASSLGLYDRAFQLLMMPLNQINAPSTKVALPILSRLQAETDRFNAFLLRGQTILVHVLALVFAFAAAQAYPLIYWVFGENWIGIVPIFQILALAGVAQAASYATYWGFLAKGLTASNLRFALCSRPVLIGMILLGSLGGLLGVASGYAIGLFLLWPAGLWWIGRASTISARAMFLNGLRPMIAYAACALGSYLASWSLTGQPLPVTFVVGAVAFGATAILLYWIWPSFRTDIITLAGFASILLRSKRPKRNTPRGRRAQRGRRRR